MDDWFKEHKVWFITKCLVTFDSNNELQIEDREINKHVPVNRILDEMGLYPLTGMQVGDRHYMIVYDGAEKHTDKTMILVSKVDLKKQTLVDMGSVDKENIVEIAKKMMGYRPLFQ